jgi:hypothetical protein
MSSRLANPRTQVHRDNHTLLSSCLAELLEIRAEPADRLHHASIATRERWMMPTAKQLARAEERLP